MKHLFILFIPALILFNSCSPESPKEENKPDKEAKKDSLDDSEKTFEESEPIPGENGIPEKVLDWYMNKYNVDSLETVVNDFNGVMLDRKKNKVYIDTHLFELANLEFFKIKYEEFIDRTSDDLSETIIDSTASGSDHIDNKSFIALNTREFLSNKNGFKDGDVHFTFYKPFYSGKSIYMHVLITHPGNGTTSFHYRFCTFKFNLSKEFVKMSCENYFQYDYAGLRTFYKEFKL